MIIVDQYKTRIINFNNIERICIENPLEDNEGTFNILCDTTNVQYRIIGKYKSEERAMEVLQEIVNAYKGYNDNKVYTMPEK